MALRGPATALLLSSLLIACGGAESRLQPAPAPVPSSGALQVPGAPPTPPGQPGSPASQESVDVPGPEDNRIFVEAGSRFLITGKPSFQPASFSGGIRGSSTARETPTLGYRTDEAVYYLFIDSPLQPKANSPFVVKAASYSGTRLRSVRFSINNPDFPIAANAQVQSFGLERLGKYLAFRPIGESNSSCVARISGDDSALLASVRAEAVISRNPDICQFAVSIDQAGSAAATEESFTASAESATAVSLAWAANDSASHYEIWRHTAAEPADARLLAVFRRNAPASYLDFNLEAGQTQYYWLRSCDDSGCPEFSRPRRITPRIVDADADGLVEIATLEQLNNVRHNLAGSGYSEGAGSVNSVGCPGQICAGYELVNSLDFDADGDGGSWRQAPDGSFILDSDDANSRYFDTAAGGWEPIGGCGIDGVCIDHGQTTVDEAADNEYFTAIFEGNGHTISNLASLRGAQTIGLFGYLGEGGEIRNLGLVNNLAKHTGKANAIIGIGGLVGQQTGGSISLCHATGLASGGASHNDRVGGLVGSQTGGLIVSSHASGRARGGRGDGDKVGGLVGYLIDGAIAASYASADVDGGAGRIDFVGGLVGASYGGAVVASYASGAVNGGDGWLDLAGGLVGYHIYGDISASYATGDASGGAGSFDEVGGFAGHQFRGKIRACYSTGGAKGGGGRQNRVGALIGNQQKLAAQSSWAFGARHGELFPGSNGTGDRPFGVNSAEGLTAANAAVIWNEAAIASDEAWDFGSSSQRPALLYGDYDGPAMLAADGEVVSGGDFHCQSDAANAPRGASLIANCHSLIPGQRPASP